MRKPIVAGQFYPGDKTELREQVESFLSIKKDKRDEKDKKDEKVKAIIAPHAGYMFSGKCAGKAYSILPKADTYIIIGVNHSGFGENIAVSLENFETPLGIVNNDTELGKEILKNFNLEEDNNAHRYEHSIEVQLPFLQVSQKDFKIVPIILKNYNLGTCGDLAKAIYEASKKLNKKVAVIASSDFTHSGPNYGIIKGKEIDKEAIDKILKLGSGKFLKIAEQTTICGAGAIASTIEFAKLLEAKQAKLLEYYTSSDIMPSENWVGYAAVAFL